MSSTRRIHFTALPLLDLQEPTHTGTHRVVIQSSTNLILTGGSISIHKDKFQHAFKFKFKLEQDLSSGKISFVEKGRPLLLLLLAASKASSSTLQDMVRV